MALDTSSDYAPHMGPQDPAEYEQWFRAKVQASIDDPRPRIPHAEVMAQMRGIISDKVAAKRG